MANFVATSKPDYYAKVAAAANGDTVEYNGVISTKFANRIDRERDIPAGVITETEVRNLIVNAPASKTYEVAGQAEDTAPLAVQYADPPDNAVAQVIHQDKQIREIWEYDLGTTTWTKTDREDLAKAASDQVKIVVSGDAVANVAPTAGQYADPVDGNDAIKVLTDGSTEYWTHDGATWSQGTTVKSGLVEEVDTIDDCPDPQTYQGSMVHVKYDSASEPETYGFYGRFETSPGSGMFFWERIEGSTGVAVAGGGAANVGRSGVETVGGFVQLDIDQLPDAP